ncbi:MAG: hypothetical protein OCC45_14905 [Desulfotalea sp.]
MATGIQTQSVGVAGIGKRRVLKGRRSTRLQLFDENFYRVFSRVLMVFIPVFVIVYGVSFMLNGKAQSRVDDLVLENSQLTTINHALKNSKTTMLSYDENIKRAKNIGLIPAEQKQVRVYSKGKFIYKYVRG